MSIESGLDVDRGDLLERIRDLERGLAATQRELEEKEERIEELESVVQTDPDDALEDVVIADNPIGKLIHKNNVRSKGNQSRVHNLEHGEVDPSELVAQGDGVADLEDLLELHRDYVVATNVDPSEYSLSPNQEIAARLFPYLVKHGTPVGQSRRIVPSTKVRQLIVEEIASPELARRLDVEDPYRATIRRVMEKIDSAGADIFEFVPASEGKRDTGVIEIDLECHQEYVESLGNEFEVSIGGGS